MTEKKARKPRVKKPVAISPSVPEDTKPIEDLIKSDHPDNKVHYRMVKTNPVTFIKERGK
jgi:hypothetical protein